MKNEFEIRGRTSFRDEGDTWQVWDDKQTMYFGIIKHYPKWKCHVFYSDTSAKSWFSSNCLDEISKKLKELDSRKPEAQKPHQDGKKEE